MMLDTIYRKVPPWTQRVLLNAYALRVEHHRYGPAYREAVRRLGEQERWSLDRLRSYQAERLQAVARIAYERTAYYRDMFDAHGIRPTDIRDVADLQRLPLLDKDIVREQGSRLMTSRGPRRGWLHGHTSGTTGTPLGLWYDRETCIMTNAVDRRQKAWGGMGDKDWIGLFLGRMIVSPDRRRPPFWQPNYVQRQVWFSSFHLSDEWIPSYLGEIRRRGLAFLEGYPSTLFILAQHLVARGQRLPLRGVFTSSETLHEVQRATIEQAFACTIFDFYGHAERTIFATECGQGSGKHVAEEFGIVEIVGADGRPASPCETGYLVGTSLHNEAMPMLRYRTGDVSRILEAPCPCGRSHRRIASVSTKAEDLVVTPDGRIISPSILTHPFKPFDSLKMSQIVQEAPDRVIVKLVPRDDFTEQDQAKLRTALEERIGSGVDVDIEIVDAIPRERSGKFRWVISKVDHSRRIDWNVADRSSSDHA